MKKITALAAVVLVGYLGTVAYVHQGDKSQAEALLAKANFSDPVQKNVAKVLFDNGCHYCHMPNAELPFYANFPIASSLMEQDIKEGYRVFQLNNLLEGMRDPKKLSEVDLAKLEQVIVNDEMPAAKFLHMHWGTRPDQDEKDIVLNWIREQRKAFLPANTKGTDTNRLVQPIPDAIPTDPKQVALGHKLYLDGRLSADGSISCHTCHQFDKGGVDNLPVSEGINGLKGGINAPTVYNAAFNFAQFWDGRATTLADQAAGPPTNPVEMGSKSWDEIIARFNQDEAFKQEFLSVYPELSQQTITHAIGEFEKTLITPNSAFDRYLKGEKNTLSIDQINGYELFKQHKCDTCHTGVAMGGQSYEYMGLYNDYFKDRGTPLTEADQGRYAQTKNDYDMHRFKVPTLRNVALTAPYMHDARTSDLKEAVRIMLHYQRGVSVSDKELSDMAAFLESLTGEHNGKKLD